MFSVIPKIQSNFLTGTGKNSKNLIYNYCKAERMEVVKS